MLSGAVMADLDVQITHSVQEVDEAAWDRLSQGRHFASYGWYRYVEAVMTDDVPYYVTVCRQGEPVARATFWLKRQEYLPVSSKVVYYLLRTYLKHRPLLVCRSPLTYISGLILPEPPLRDAALTAIGEAALQIARQDRASVVLFDYLQENEVKIPGWPGDFIPFEFPNPDTKLAIRWPDFESYLSDAGKSVKKDYHRHSNRAADLGIRVEYASRMDDPEQAQVLIRNVEQHHGAFPNPAVRSILDHADVGNSTWLTARIGDRLVGCGLLLKDRDAEILAMLGLDYDVKYVYFQLFYAAIRHAIETGTRVLYGGSGAAELKSRLGFDPEARNYSVFTSRNPILRALGRQVGIN